MPLTDSEKNRFMQWIREKGGQNPSKCPVCGEPNKWWPGDVVVMPELTGEGNLQIDEQSSIPVVQLICGNCGYVRFFNATMISMGGEGYTREG